MQKTGSKVFYSATDLTHFAECQHLSWLDRLNLDEPMEKTVADEHAKLIQAKGFSHEATFLDKLTARHAGVVAIDTKGSDEERAAQTRAAIASGAETIYQASFIRDNLIGHADFLTRVGAPDASGSYRYEVVDTKLARSAKAKFILQLCFYSDLLGDVTGQLPLHMHVRYNGVSVTFKSGAVSTAATLTPYFDCRQNRREPRTTGQVTRVSATFPCARPLTALRSALAIRIDHGREKTVRSRVR